MNLKNDLRIYRYADRRFQIYENDALFGKIQSVFRQEDLQDTGYILDL